MLLFINQLYSDRRAIHKKNLPVEVDNQKNPPCLLKIPYNTIFHMLGWKKKQH